MRNLTKMAVCGVVALGLGGCNGTLSKLGLGKYAPAEKVSPSNAGSDSKRLAFGLEALRKGAPGNAITHLERAILDPKVAPQAYNAMGVAYAQLGREDLAERFFNVAIMLRPSDERFTRNLARLNGSSLAETPRALAAKDAEAREFWARTEKAAIDEGLIEEKSDEVERRGALTIDRRTSQFHRVSKGEIRVASKVTYAKLRPSPVEHPGVGHRKLDKPIGGKKIELPAVDRVASLNVAAFCEANPELIRKVAEAEKAKETRAPAKTKAISVARLTPAD